jgi:HEPN domain-containing protein
MRTRESSPSDWFALASERLRAADALHSVEGATWAGVELLHEAAERYLKGFLVARGWEIRRTHDLAHLVAEASRFESALAEVAESAADLTEQFWAQHYPGGDLTDVAGNYNDLRGAVALIAVLTTQNEPDPPRDDAGR